MYMPPPEGEPMSALIVLLTISGVPALDMVIPPPLPEMFDIIKLWLIVAKVKDKYIPPPLFSRIVLASISGAPPKIPIPPLPELLEITFPEIVGDEFWIKIPPPSYELSKPAEPFVIVNPDNSVTPGSPDLKLTTESLAAPSIMVTSGPLVLVTVISLPLT